MLINISNHSLSEWDDNQARNAKHLFCSITDIEFPIVDPEGDEAYIKNLCEKYADLIRRKLSLSKDAGNAVHVMGEFTFAFKLVALLKSEGIKCVASTSKRNSVLTDEGKLSSFNFVRFREY